MDTERTFADDDGNSGALDGVEESRRPDAHVIIS
jgi:hypothetical protein